MRHRLAYPLLSLVEMANPPLCLKTHPVLVVHADPSAHRPTDATPTMSDSSTDGWAEEPVSSMV